MSTDASVVATFLPAGVNGKIVYDCAFDICVVNEDGTGLVNLTNSPTVYDIHPVWSPEGTRIAFASSRTSVATNTDGYIEIFVMNADGSGVVQQTFTTTGPGQFINSYDPVGIRPARRSCSRGGAPAGSRRSSRSTSTAMGPKPS